MTNSTKVVRIFDFGVPEILTFADYPMPESARMTCAYGLKRRLSRAGISTSGPTAFVKTHVH